MPDKDQLIIKRVKEKLFQCREPPKDKHYLSGYTDWLLESIERDGKFRLDSDGIIRRGMNYSKCH